MPTLAVTKLRQAFKRLNAKLDNQYTLHSDRKGYSLRKLLPDRGTERISPVKTPAKLLEWLLVFELGVDAKTEPQEVDNDGTSPWYCRNCNYHGTEADFWPSDGTPVDHICPECGSASQCFPGVGIDKICLEES